MTFEAELQARAAAIEQQVQRVEACADPATRAAAMDLISSVMELHGEAIERMLAIVAADGGGLAESFARDPLIHGVLALHDLHPESLQARVQRALQAAQPKLHQHRAQAELISIENGVVQVTLSTDLAHQCGSAALETELRQALVDAVPDAAEIVVKAAQPIANFISIDALRPAAQVAGISEK